VAQLDAIARNLQSDIEVETQIILEDANKLITTQVCVDARGAHPSLASDGFFGS
jgi:hypothetical protein